MRYAAAPPAPDAPQRVYILLAAAWGMGGTIRTTLSLAEWLARDHEVVVISVGRGRDEPFFEFPPDIQVVLLDDKRKGARRPWLGRLLRPLPSVLIHPLDRGAKGFDLWVDLQLVRTLRGCAGWLITTRPGYNLIAAQAELPGLTTIGVEHMHLSHHRQQLRRAMLAHYCSLDALVVLTEADRAEYVARFGERLRVIRIPNAGRDLGGARADLSARRVLAAGRLGPQKGYDMLIAAWIEVVRRHPDWTLRICGDGPQRRPLERLVKELALEDSVELAPPSRELGREMASASIFALSSRFEGLPLVLLEAMSAGMGIVSFDCPTGPRELIADHANGLLVPPRNVPALAAALCELIEDPQLLAACSAAALSTAEDYDMQHLGPQWDALLRELGAAPVRKQPGCSSTLVA